MNITHEKTMKQTAVDWLMALTEYNEILEQAKAMEKEQIINAFNQSWHDRMNPYKTADKYYNETYESND